MKPIGPIVNNKPTSCDDYTASCVMWDGPNISIDCLGVRICKGEEITPILYNSVKNLCDILDRINMENVSVECIGNIINTNRSINDIFNIIIERMCVESDKINALENTYNEVLYADLPYCLQEFSDALTITKLKLPEYYQKLALQICLYITDIIALQDAVKPGSYIQTQLALLQVEITALCSATTALVTPTCTADKTNQVAIQNITNPFLDELLITTTVPHNLITGNHVNIYGVVPSYYNLNNLEILVNSPTQFTVIGPGGLAPSYISGGFTVPVTSMSVETAYSLLERAFCSFKNFTGTREELTAAIARDCPNLGDLPRLTNTGTMKDIVGWVDTPFNVADSMTNLWLTVCDLRSAINNLQLGCCVDSPCLSFDIGYTLVFNPTYLTVVFSGNSTIKSLDRLNAYTGGFIPGWLIADFPVVDNVTITLNDGSGDVVYDTGQTIMSLMTGGAYVLNYPMDYDSNAPIKTINITFDYKWNNPVHPGDTDCTTCECCCTFNLTNGIY